MLREHIIASGQSRNYWARRLGISAAYLSQLENRRKQPGLTLAALIEQETGGAIPAASWVDLPTSPDTLAPSSGEAA